MDSHDIGRNRGGIKNALRQITAHTTVIGIASDFLFPTSEQKFIADHIPGANYYEIESILGHDGFLTESKNVSKIIFHALNNKPNTTYLKVS